MEARANDPQLHNDSGRNNNNNTRDAPSVRSSSHAKGAAHCHGICVSDLATIMEQLEKQGQELGLETGWDDHDIEKDDHAKDSKQGTEEEEEEEEHEKHREADIYTKTAKPLYTVRRSGKHSKEQKVDLKSEECEMPLEKEEKQNLMQTSCTTAAAIFLHNFPEGIAGFIATLQDPKVGIVLAVAIAIHNIPEGLCVALPAYYANQSKWQAFGLACLSGLSEPVAALCLWLVIGNSVSDNLFGVMFGIVAGMMVLISVRELLPTAIQYDKENTIVTKGVCVGMLIMAASLVLFAL